MKQDTNPASRDASRSTWLAISATSVVFLLVLFQLVGFGSAGRHGGTPLFRNIEQSIAAGEWTAAIDACQLHLLSFPLEARARFLLARCYCEQGLAGLALEHLVLATTSPPPGSAVLRDGAPTREEVAGLLAELETRAAKDLDSDWSHLRKARLFHVIEDQSRFAQELQAAASTKSTVSTASTAGELPPTYCLAALTAVLGPQRDVEVAVEISDAQASALTDLMGARLADASVPGLDALMAGGAHAGGRYITWSGGTQRDYACSCGWLFQALDPANGSVVKTICLGLMPLTDEGKAIRDWSASLPRDAVVVGFASGEALAFTSQEARSALRDVFGLQTIPAANTMTAYVFVQVRDSANAPRVLEQAAPAPDVPAMLILRGGVQ